MQTYDWRGVKVFALMDLVVTGALAVPVLSAWVLALLLSGLGTQGAPSDWLPLPLTTMIFCNLAGVLGVLWNGLRLFRPEPLWVRMDQWGRVAVAALFVYYLLVHDAPVVFWLFVGTELAGSLVAWRTLQTKGR
jgi:hypothetical protein